ncbi:hypothetical protein A8B98_19465 [Hymenobacter sp. UV11]|nr:hypothetical protein A8B98_19465 [Hymenobacter sp. UV11]
MLYLVLALGVLLRLFHFLYNRSFFTDELFLNVNLLEKDFWELATTPLRYEQKAPIGYLWTARLCALLFGPREPALRLLSLLSGLVALGGFVPVARYFVRGWGVVVAVGVLALGSPAIYHAVEAKQYSTELCATVLALLLYLRYHNRPGWPALLAWGLLGSLLLLFSFSVIFVLAGIGLVLAAHAAWQRRWLRLVQYAIPGGMWVLTFGVIYLLFVSKFLSSGWLPDFFRVRYDAYPDLHHPVAAAKWLVHKGYQILDRPLGLLLSSDNHLLKLGWVSLPVLGIGVVFLLKEHRQWLALLLLPVALALLAAAAGQYPFHERFLLFLAPLLLLVLGYGVQVVERRVSSSVAVGTLVTLLLLPPATNSTRQALNPDLFYNRSYSRQLLLHVNAHWQPGDVVYVYWNMQPAYEYYKKAYKLKFDAVAAHHAKNQSSSQADYLRHLQPDFVAFAGKRRLWFIYDTNLRDPTGDYVDKPAWYYDARYPPGRVLNEYFAATTRRLAYFHLDNYSTTLYALPAVPLRPWGSLPGPTAH